MIVEEGDDWTQLEGRLPTRRGEMYDRVCIGKHETGSRRKWREVTTDGVKVVDAERSPLDS